jgi:hypothetical protein
MPCRQLGCDEKNLFCKKKTGKTVAVCLKPSLQSSVMVITWLDGVFTLLMFILFNRNEM